MNYLEHHLGDYAKRALSFSMLQHGAYSVLRDRYFTKEQPIPAADVHRVASARTREERAAVDAVLAEFYRLDGDVWRCDEFDAQLVVAGNKIAAAQQNGKKGGRPKKNRNETEQKPSGFSVGSISETQVKAHQTPDTNHQSPVIQDDTHLATSVARVSPEGPEQRSTQTMAGAVCITLRAKGIGSVNPSHPDLLALLSAGVDIGAFASAAEVAVERGHARFPYVLGVVKGQLADSQRMAQQAASAPPSSRPETRKDRQLQTAAGLTGAVQRQQPKPTEVFDVDARVIPS